MAIFRIIGNVIVILMIMLSVYSTEQEQEAHIGGAETLKNSLLICQLLACPTQVRLYLKHLPALRCGWEVGEMGKGVGGEEGEL